ncbi:MULTISPECIES: hypothetical protein [unclassified Mesorhizobium]|uniref:hypothetical protein n=1 Tax=unclassified Mesorhizobium TaxID=325217 RepID=UPI00333A26CC
MAWVQNWVWLVNWNPLIDELGHMAGEALDVGLRRILEDELKETDTDASPQRWASCHFDGPRPIAALFGIDQGTDILLVRIEVPDNLSVRAETTLDLMKSYAFVALD